MQAFSSCGKWGLLSSCSSGPLTAVASPVASTGSRVCGLQWSGHMGSAALGLQSVGPLVVAQAPWSQLRSLVALWHVGS